MSTTTTRVDPHDPPVVTLAELDARRVRRLADLASVQATAEHERDEAARRERNRQRMASVRARQAQIAAACRPVVSDRGERWASIQAAAFALGCRHSNVSQSLRDGLRCCGRRLRYAERESA